MRGCVNCNGEPVDEYTLTLGRTERLELWLCEPCLRALLNHEYITVAE
jgi:hypothetical protein